jgi:exodeoxyribonuclease VII small subunit
MGDETEPNFEKSLAQLEQIVASLERGEPELTSALSKYEKGVQLLSICHRLLEKAEQSVALLTGVDEEGQPITAPFDATATVARQESSPSSAAETSTATLDIKRQTTTERIVVRRSRAKPAEASGDPNDPPF